MAVPPPLDTSRSATADRAEIERRCPIPFSIGDQTKGIELSAKFGAGALAKLATLPDLEGRGGYEVVKSAYAGLSNQAMSAVFDALACRINLYLEKTAPTDRDAKSAAVAKAVAYLELEMALVQNAAAVDTNALSALKEEFIGHDTRAAQAPVLDAAITKAALADVNPTALFINTKTKQGWLGLKIGPHIDVSACGGVVEAAISDGSSSLQQSLSRTKAILINFLDPTTPPYVPLASLFTAVALSPITKAKADAVSFKDCSKGVAAQRDEPIADDAQPVSPASTRILPK